MKKSDFKKLLESVIKEELNEWDEPGIDFGGDGYSNDSQRAFAHSQATTPRGNATKKAIELAKKGKFVLVVENPVYCKSTDACLGNDISIHGVFNNREDAEKEQEKFNVAEHSDTYTRIIGPDNLEPKKYKDTVGNDDEDVPFEESQKSDVLSYHATSNVKDAIKFANDIIASDDEIDFGALLLHIQNEFALDDYETYLVGVNSTYPTSEEFWKTAAKGKFKQFAIGKDAYNENLIDSGQKFAVYGKGTATSRSAGWSFLGWDNDLDNSIKKYPQAEFIKSNVGNPDEKTVWVKSRGKLANEGYGMGDMSKDSKKAFKGAKWTVKYNESKTIKLSEFKKMVQSIITEIIEGADGMSDIENLPGNMDLDGGGDVGDTDGGSNLKRATGRLIEPGSDEEMVSMYKNGGSSMAENWQVGQPPNKELDTEGIRNLHESKGKNKREKLLSIVRDVLKEVTSNKKKK